MHRDPCPPVREEMARQLRTRSSGSTYETSRALTRTPVRVTISPGYAEYGIIESGCESTLSTPSASGNVFQDLGFVDPESALVKADLARAISRIIKERGLTQAAAAEQMALDQPKVSAITRGRLNGFSVERLMECLKTLDQDVIIAIHPSAGKGGKIRRAA